MSRQANTETESRLVVAREQGKREQGLTVKRHRVSFGDDINVLELESGDGCTI